MNRMQPKQVRQPTKQDANYSVEWARYGQASAPHHVLFAPLHYEPAYAYPLVVWLHGPRDNEHQLKRVMPNLSMRNYVATAPRGTVEIRLATETLGYRWEQSESHIQTAEHAVMAAIDGAQEKFNIAPQRIFLAGFGCGGTMAYRIAANHPGQFAGALSLGGGFPTGHRPLRNLNDMRRLPLFLACGTESRHYSPDDVCRDLRLFHSAGLSVTVRQYPCGDELTTLMLGDMNRWIMEQFCPTASTVGTESSR